MLLPFQARAQPEGASPVRIVYQAPAGCPDEAAFVRELEARVKVLRLARQGELARVVIIKIESDAKASRASVELTDVDGQRVRREVGAATCPEVVSAIALVTALAVDAKTEEHEQAPSAPAPAREPSPREDGEKSPAPRSTSGAPPAREPARSMDRTWLFGVAGGFATGFAPDAIAFVRGFAAIELARRYELRLSAAHGSASAIRSAGLVRFQATWARAEGCLVVARIGQRGGLAPCVGLEAGLLDAQGVELPPRITESRSATEPWAAAVALGRLRLVEQVVFVEIQGELVAPVVRHEFVLDNPSANVHEFPVLAVSASLGVGAMVE